MSYRLEYREQLFNIFHRHFNQNYTKMSKELGISVVSLKLCLDLKLQLPTESNTEKENAESILREKFGVKFPEPNFPRNDSGKVLKVLLDIEELMWECDEAFDWEGGNISMAYALAERWANATENYPQELIRASNIEDTLHEVINDAIKYGTDVDSKTNLLEIVQLNIPQAVRLYLEDNNLSLSDPVKD